VFFDDDYRETPVYQRAALAPGGVVVGPAIIEEYGSTIPLHPGFTASVDPFGNLIVTTSGKLWPQGASETTSSGKL
jgi:N-methylhydantoinase A